MLPTVSIIIPIHNVEAYLRACLDSVLSQSYPDWECVMVDDFSTDASASVAEEYCNRDSRFKLISHSANRGLSAARNTALDAISGQYVAFIDSDDWIHCNFISAHIDMLTRNQADMASTMLSSELPLKTQPSTITTALPREAIRDCLYQQPPFCSSVSGKIFKSQLFCGIRFTEGIAYEDLEIFPRLWSRAHRIVASDASYYYYRKRSGSILHTFNSSRLDVLEITEAIYQAYTSDPMLGPAASDRCLSANFNIFLLLCANNLDKTEESDKCWQRIRRLRKRSLINPRVRTKNKAGIVASYLLGRRLFALIGKKC